MDVITFWFDPACPWTWITSRWLVEAAGRRDVGVEWRSLSLPALNKGRDVPPQFRGAMDASAAAHRVFAALAADGRQDLIGALYTELGRRWHHDGGERTVDAVVAAADAVGAGAWSASARDEALDATVESSTQEAVRLAGPDVGSPVLSWGDPVVAVFGPILSPAPTGEAAAVLLDRIAELAATPGFYELKRGRTEGPAFGPRP